MQDLEPETDFTLGITQHQKFHFILIKMIM